MCSVFPPTYGSIIYINITMNYRICKVPDECSRNVEESEYILQPFTTLLISEIIPNFVHDHDFIYTKYVCDVISTVVEFDKCDTIDLATNISDKLFKFI